MLISQLFTFLTALVTVPCSLPCSSYFGPSCYLPFANFLVAGPELADAMDPLKIVSMNVNGLNMDAKRRIIFDHLRKTKADIALLQETHATSAVEKIWGKEWGGASFFNNGTRSSRGVAILVNRNLSFNVCSINTDDHGRILCLDIEIDDITYSVGSLYAPTQDRGREQLAFVDSIDVILLKSQATNVILAGDFNHCMSPSLDRSSHSFSPNAEQMGQKMSSLQQEWDLTDVWRVRNPDSKAFTFRRGLYASRLDYFLISSHLSDTVQSTGLKMTPHSGHAIIDISLGDSERSRGPGLWRLDTALLGRNDYITEMSEFLTHWSAPKELTNPNSIWEWLKYEIQTFTNKFTSRLHSEEKQHISDLNKELSKLYSEVDNSGEDKTFEIDSARRELREIEEAKARKIILRAKCNWTLFGERPSKYFLNLEKRKTKKKTLHSILAADGSILSKPEDILNEGRNYYSDLYHDQEESLSPLPEIQERLQTLSFPKLSEEDSAKLEAPFSEEELKKALGQLNTSKTPGSDGLPPEFYSSFWQYLSRYFCSSLDHSIETGIMSVSQRRGIITLVPKKDVDRRLISSSMKIRQDLCRED